MIISGVNRSLDLNRFLFIIIYKEEKKYDGSLAIKENTNPGNGTESP